MGSGNARDLFTGGNKKENIIRVWHAYILGELSIKRHAGAYWTNFVRSLCFWMNNEWLWLLIEVQYLCWGKELGIGFIIFFVYRIHKGCIPPIKAQIYCCPTSYVWSTVGFGMHAFLPTSYRLQYWHETCFSSCKNYVSKIIFTQGKFTCRCFLATLWEYTLWNSNTAVIVRRDPHLGFLLLTKQPIYCSRLLTTRQSSPHTVRSILLIHTILLTLPTSLSQKEFKDPAKQFKVEQS